MPVTMPVLQEISSRWDAKKQAGENTLGLEFRNTFSSQF